MKTQISRDSHAPGKRYSGVYQQQGRMLTDADWNALVEILKDRLNDALKDVVGDGSPKHRSVLCDKDGKLNLQWGRVYVDGLYADVRSDGHASLNNSFQYGHQEDFPCAPELPSASGYTLYADVWERPVTFLEDSQLLDAALHGADTCTRMQTMAQVKWCQGIDPENPDQNPAMGNAQLTVKLPSRLMKKDPCDPCANQVKLDSRVGNYLFRVEVHDVAGDANSPTEITLKWSSENGAEQCEAHDKKEMPPAFFNDNWAYEFFNVASEKHLGVHLGVTSWKPARNSLTKIYEVPSGSPDKPNSFVRRWNGYCVLKKTGGSWSVSEQHDLTQVNLNTFANIDNGVLTINLDLQIELSLAGTFVAGDYWLVEVREARKNTEGSLLDKAAPCGIKHHYLTLGKVGSDGNLVPNPEADRKYAFPSLTEMTRIFSAGGDGQEAMPGQKLPQPLRVAVANGEWPVEGATVRFQLIKDNEELELIGVAETDREGIAKCEWTPEVGPNTKPRVKATLVNPRFPNEPDKDFNPPIFFYANLSTADQVAYAPPPCQSSNENSVLKLLSDDLTPPLLSLGQDGYYTVMKILDALLCKLKASHVPFAPQNCDTHAEPTVKSLLGVNNPTTVHDVLQDLLCGLDASTLPYTYGPDLECDYLKNATTVKNAIDLLCIKPSGCAVTVGDKGRFKTLKDAFDNLMEEQSICICLLPQAEQHVADNLTVGGKRSIKVTGCGAAASQVSVRGGFSLSADEIVLRDVAFFMSDGENKGSLLIDAQGGAVKKAATSKAKLASMGQTFSKAPQVSPQKANEALIDALQHPPQNFISVVAQPDATLPVDLGQRDTISFHSTVIVENSLFLREPSNSPLPIQPPLVELKGSMQVHWNANTMMAQGNADAERFAKKTLLVRLLGSFLPPDELLSSDPCVDNKADFNAIAGNWARETVGKINSDFSSAWLTEIIKLSGEIEISHEIAGFILELRAIFAVSKEKKELAISALSETIKDIAIWLFSPADAFVLDSSVCGWIADNRIVGQVVLFNDVARGNDLPWWNRAIETPPKLLGQQGGSSQGELELRGNVLTAVRCRTPKLVNGSILSRYSSLSVRDNVFQRPSSNFTGQSVNVSGNQFNGVPTGGITLVRMNGLDGPFSGIATGGGIVARVLGYSGIVMGNQANQPPEISEMRCNFTRPLAEAANLLSITQPQ